jgi:NAD(P)-dependent dehydrogenase (short-subunit alcohol dehydrogenase family)
MDRPVLITGGSRGIGAATARAAAGHGHSVCVVYREDEAAARRVVDALKESGGRALAFRADVVVEREVDLLFEAVDREFGGLFGLVNCAGYMGAPTRIQTCGTDLWNRVFATNVLGTFLPTRAAIPRMSTATGGVGGAIVNVSSMAAVLGGGGEFVHYAASKGAIESFTLGLSRELACEGIRVNAVRPGLIETELHSRTGDAGRLERLAKTVPVGRAGQPSEVAEAIVWLLSDAASYVTGTVLTVSGGR